MGHLLCVANQALFNQQVRNTFYVGGNDAVMANAQDIIDALTDCWIDNIQSALVNDWNLYSWTVYDKTIPSVPGVEYTPTAGTVVGGASGEPLPTQIAFLVGFKAQASPPNKNRKYLAGCFNGQVVNGTWTAATRVAFQAWGDQVLDIDAATGLAIVFEVVALDTDGTVLGGNPLQTAFTRSVPATQRRRRIGVGI